MVRLELYSSYQMCELPWALIGLIYGVFCFVCYAFVLTCLLLLFVCAFCRD